MAAALLGSWKEIATFFGKGVRTVQRWERDLGLPVHRPPERDQGVVIAFPEELTNWAKRQHRSGNGAAISQAQIERMHQLRSTMLARAAKLQANAEKVSASASRVVASLKSLEAKPTKPTN